MKACKPAIEVEPYPRGIFLGLPGECTSGAVLLVAAGLRGHSVV